jgi:hypothetical protein
MSDTQSIPAKMPLDEPIPELAEGWHGGTEKTSRYPVLGSSAVRALRAIFSLLVLCWLRQPVIAAANPDQDHVLAETRQRVEALDYRVSGKLTRLDGQGHRTTNKFNVKGHWFPDGLRLLVETTDLTGVPSQVLLHMSVNGHVTIEVLARGSKVATALPFERWNEGLLGTDLSYEDLLESQFFWKSQEFLAPEPYDAHTCFVVKSAADAGDRSHYSSVTSWIDRDMFYPVHVMKTLRATGQQKEFNYFGFRQSSGAWSATHLEVKMQGGQGSSLFVIERGSDKAKLMLKDFALAPPVTIGDQ